MSLLVKIIYSLENKIPIDLIRLIIKSFYFVCPHDCKKNYTDRENIPIESEIYNYELIDGRYCNHCEKYCNKCIIMLSKKSRSGKYISPDEFIKLMKNSSNDNFEGIYDIFTVNTDFKYILENGKTLAEECIHLAFMIWTRYWAIRNLIPFLAEEMIIKYNAKMDDFSKELLTLWVNKYNWYTPHWEMTKKQADAFIKAGWNRIQ